VGLSTVKGFEGGTKSPMNNNLKAMREALEAAGIEITNGGAPGVKIWRMASEPSMPAS
jgi:hypothetical protein